MPADRHEFAVDGTVERIGLPGPGDAGAVGEADVLGRGGAELVASVGPATAGPPVSADALVVHDGDVGGGQPEAAQGVRFGLDGDRFRAGAEYDE